MSDYFCAEYLLLGYLIWLLIRIGLGERLE